MVKEALPQEFMEILCNTKDYTVVAQDIRDANLDALPKVKEFEPIDNNTFSPKQFFRARCST